MAETLVLRDNDAAYLELIFREIRKIDHKVLFNVVYFPSSVRVQLQCDETLRGKVFNKLHHIHNIFGLKFKPTQFIKRTKSLVTFDLSVLYNTDNE